MIKIGQIILALNYFSLGIMAPVLNLILLDKGATLQTLPLLLAVYSCTVFLFELPSGICADTYGRKIVFMLACVFQICSNVTLIFTNHMILLPFVAIMMGFGRAFSSGSLDALLIDDVLESKGETSLPYITSKLAIVEGAGLTLGGIAGGLLTLFRPQYQSNMLVCIIANGLAFLLCYFIIKENQVVKSSKQVENNVAIRLPNIKSLITQNNPSKYSNRLWWIVFGMFFTGIAMSVTETYWQSAFQEMQNNSVWLLGVISSLGFVASMLGNVIVGNILARLEQKRWILLYGCRFILAIVLIMIAVQRSRLGFIMVYSLLYFTLGTSSVVENTLLHQLIPSKLRASFLSLTSFVLQIGFFIASVISNIFVPILHFSGLWILSGILMFLFTIMMIGISFLSLQRKIYKSESAKKEI
ncbi:MAG: MFS transporter [Candidatus Galacturonibacter soehngenii]|nr:MFS transporter [Candidatus Galacturonibacter soehngenii]